MWGFIIFLVMMISAYIGMVYGVYEGDWAWPRLVIEALPKPTTADECTKSCVNGELIDCTCKCPVGYTGDYCEIKKGTTVPPPPVCDKKCTQGQLDSNICDCICNQGFKKVGDACVACENACVNGTRQTNGCACACKIGWYGPACDSRDPIDNILCDKTCSFGTLNPDNCQCDCWKFYSGPTCNIRDCTDTPCVNGTQDNLCNCDCDEGWMGRACDEPITPACETTVCYNGDLDDNCKCICRPGFTGQTCRIVGSNGTSVDYNTCVTTPGAVWTGYQCMAIDGGCPMGTGPHQCVNRGGFNYVHDYNSNDPWQCVLGDERNGGYIGDPSSYYYGGRCMTAQSTPACTQLIEDMGCNVMPSVLFENL